MILNVIINEDEIMLFFIDMYLWISFCFAVVVFVFQSEYILHPTLQHSNIFEFEWDPEELICKRLHSV